MAVKVTSRVGAGKAAVLDVATLGLTKTCAERIVPAAKALAPVLTGATRDSINFKITQPAKGPKARVFTKSGHGFFAERGTSRQAAHPFLLPAAQANIGNVAIDMKEVAVTKYK